MGQTVDDNFESSHVQHKALCGVGDMFYKLPHNHQHHTKPYVVHGLIRNYHLQFDLELGQGKCEIRHIPCVYNSYTDHLDFIWIPTYSDDKKPRYKLPKHYFHSNILSELSECNIITLINRDTYLK